MAGWLHRRSPKSLGLLVAAGLLALSSLVPDSHASWTAAVGNARDAAGTGTVAFTHVYASGTCTSAPAGSVPYASEIACPGSVAPTAPTPSSGSVTGTDAITANGTLPAAGIVEQVRVESCGPARFTNRINGSNPMLARYNTAFASSGGPMGGAGYVTLDGASPGAYAASIVQQTQPPPALAVGPVYGLGIWFKTSSNAGGPLFGFGDSPINVASTNDRILYMDTAGRLRFIYNNLGSQTPLTSAAYNNGQWHFAYVRLEVVLVALIGLIPRVTLFVDGVQAAQTPLISLLGYTPYAGYWHVGWSPVSGLPSYFTGSLSNFVVANNSPAPANPGVPASQAAFNSAFASSGTEHWVLDDPGTTTYAGVLPVIGASDPCSAVNGQWGFTNPTSCAWSPQSLAAGCTSTTALSQMVADGWRQVSSPAPGGAQTGTLATSRGGSYSSGFMPGLRLYVPLLFKAVTAAGAWGNTFAWRTASSAVLG